MTRKDYVKFAAMFGRLPKDTMMWVVANAIADIFAADNPHFDRARFMKAAGFPAL